MAATKKRDWLHDAAHLWPTLPQEEVNRHEIETRPEYQPRDPDLIKGNVARFRQMQILEEMVEEMVTFLKASPRNHTDPVWIVEIDGRKILVDGHHRLKAYSRTKRPTVPAKVYRGKNAATLARLSCRLANVRGSRIQLHPSEIGEAVWQTLRELSFDGRRSWGEVQADGYSYRSLRAQFSGQPALGTLSAMTKQLGPARQKLQREGSWPSWKEHLKWLREKHLDPSNNIEEKEIDVEKLADKLAREFEKLSRDERLHVYKRTEETLGEVDKAQMKKMGIYISDEFEDDIEYATVDELDF